MCFADNPEDLVLPGQDTWEDVIDLVFNCVIGYGKSTPKFVVPTVAFAAKGVRCRAIQYLFYTENIIKLLIAPYCITSEFPYLGQVRGSQGPNSEN
jgi:hypothetical protein